MNNLQTYDGVVKSVLEVRGIRNDLSDEEYASWYEERYKITYMRVLGILRAAEVGGQIRPIGTMELGLTSSARQSMWPVFDAYKSGESKEHVYVKPLVRCKVKYRDWYKSGLMRLPVFQEFIV